MSIWRGLGRRHKREEDLEEEIRSHFQMAVRDGMDGNVSVEQANSSARREFGNVGLVKEITREMWGWTSVERLMQDVRYAARVLRKSPGFAITAVLSIALGVGANSAIVSVIDERMIAKLSGFFGLLALTLAAIGLYGVMSYLTARRTVEIGIRYALGAERSAVVGMVLSDTFRLVVARVSVGILVSIFVAKLFAKSLFGLSPFDPATMILAAAIITIAAAVAAYLPALRASRVDPLIALRYE